MTLAISSTDHADMEYVMTNLIEKNDVVLIANHGIWGERAMDMARRQGKRSRKSQLDLFAFLLKKPKESRKALTKFLYEATTTTLKKFLPSFSLFIPPISVLYILAETFRNADQYTLYCKQRWPMCIPLFIYVYI